MPLAWIPAAEIEVSRNDAEVRFPDTITFHLSASSSATIESAELEFGTDARACGESISRVVPDDFQPGASIVTEWEWDLRRTGALPPGTTLWWHWILRDRSGAVHTTPDQELAIQDQQYPWQERTSGQLHLHWYEGTASFAQDLLDAGQDALATIHADMGVDYEGDIRLYIYADPSAMQAATLFAPDWSGGLAFVEHSAILIAISPGQLEWSRRTVAHELTHVVVGQYTFSCLNSTPPWVDEGLAMYTEGDLEAGLNNQLQDTIQNATLLPVRSLGEIFSNDPDRARLAYAQSYGLVSLLLQTHGPEKMLALLDQFRQGTSIDLALRNVYGFDLDALDRAWRESIGAPPDLSTPISGEDSTRTPYPTFAPLGGSNAVAATATPPSGEPANPRPTTGLCGTSGAIGLAVLRLMLSPRRRRQEGPR